MQSITWDSQSYPEAKFSIVKYSEKSTYTLRSVVIVFVQIIILNGEQMISIDFNTLQAK